MLFIEAHVIVVWISMSNNYRLIPLLLLNTILHHIYIPPGTEWNSRESAIWKSVNGAQLKRWLLAPAFNLRRENGRRTRDGLGNFPIRKKISVNFFLVCLGLVDIFHRWWPEGCSRFGAAWRGLFESFSRNLTDILLKKPTALSGNAALGFGLKCPRHGCIWGSFLRSLGLSRWTLCYVSVVFLLVFLLLLQLW